MGGNLSNPGQPAFLAYNSATDINQTGDNTTYTVDFDTEVFDQGGDFAADIFTAPVDGRYQFNICVRLDALDEDTFEMVRMRLVTSNRTYSAWRSGLPWATGGIASFVISYLVDMDADDTAYVNIRATGGAKVVDITTETYFSGALIC